MRFSVDLSTVLIASLLAIGCSRSDSADTETMRQQLGPNFQLQMDETKDTSEVEAQSTADPSSPP
jgi:hypothetical protein